MCKSIVETREKYYDIGLKKGYEQGRTKGYRGAFLEIYAIEFAKGYVEGYEKIQHKCALALFKNGMSQQKISQLLELDVDLAAQWHNEWHTPT